MGIVYLPHLGASVALQSGTVGGNTSGAATFFGSNIVWAGGSNVTLQASSDTVYIHGASAGTATGGGGAGTDWAITGGSITVNTSGGTISLPAYLTTAAPPGAYLTTAAQSDHSHGALSLVNLTGTSASGGLTLSAAAPGGGGAIMVSAGTTSGNVQTLALADLNGISFGLSGSTVTASHNGYTGATTQWLTTAQPPGAYLTTAGLSQDSSKYAGTAGAITGGSITVNTSGVSVALPAYLTTAQPVGAYLTTAAQVSHSHNLATTTTNGASIVVATANSAGATIAVPPYLTTAQPVGAYLTTARASSDAIGLNTALTANGVSWTVNSSGLSLNVPAFLTTAAQVSHSHGFATTTTNGSLIVVATSNSAGVTMAVPPYLTAAAGGGGVAVAGSGASTVTSGTVQFGNLNGVSFGLNGSTMTASYNSTQFAGTGTSATNASITLNSNGLAISVAAPGGGAAQTFSAGTASGSANPVHFSNANGVSWGLGTGASSSVITASVNAGGGAAPGVRWACPQWAGADFVLLTNITAMTQRPMFFPFECGGNLTGGEIHWRMSRSTSGSNNFTVHVGAYSHVNQTQISLFGSTSAAFSNTATASISGVRAFEMGVGTALSTLSQGQWVLGIIFSATATASMNYSLMGASTLNPGVGRIDAGSDQYVTYTSHFEQPFWGRFTTTTGALPGSVGQAAVVGGISGASLPLPMNFTLASHY